MIDITALLIAGMETKYAILGALCIVCAGVFTALYFSLKQNSNKQLYIITWIRANLICNIFKFQDHL